MKKAIIFSIIIAVLFCSPLFYYKLFDTSVNIFEFFYPLILGFIFLLATIGASVNVTRKLVNVRKQGMFAISVNVVFLTMVFIFLVYNIIPQFRLPKGSNLMKFDSSVWKTDEPQFSKAGISTREKMLGDLVFNVLPGKTISEIEELLGTSLETNYFKSVDKDLIYYMGPERDSPFAIDSEWLLIWVDASNMFEKYELVTD